MCRAKAFGAWVLALAMTGAACSSSPQPQSNTPAITDDPSATRDPSLLLTEADVHAIPGLHDTTAKDLADVDAFENPDPRGPCGDRVPQPPGSGRYGRGFTGNGVAVVEVLQPASAATSAYVEAMRADARRGCGPYTSRTNQGYVQTVSDTMVLDLPGCDRCVGATAKVSIESAEDQTMFIGVLVFEVAGVHTVVQVNSADAVAPAMMIDLFRRARSHLSV